MSVEGVSTIDDISKIMKQDKPVIKRVPFKNHTYDMRLNFLYSQLNDYFTYDDISYGFMG